jgi:hypothetical protein
VLKPTWKSCQRSDSIKRARAIHDITNVSQSDDANAGQAHNSAVSVHDDTKVAVDTDSGNSHTFSAAMDAPAEFETCCICLQDMVLGIATISCGHVPRGLLTPKCSLLTRSLRMTHPIISHWRSVLARLMS